MNLDGAVVLITGGGDGIGFACAQELLQCGCRVSVVDVLETSATGTDENAMFTLGDITSADTRRLVVEQTLARFGKIDVLINNAGVGLYGYAASAPLEESRRLFDVNVFAPLAMAQLVAPLMQARKDGAIVNISSIGGKVALPWASMYCASKFAFQCVSDCLRRELSSSGVRVLTVMPGVVATNFRDHVLAGLPPSRVGTITGMSPKRLARAIRKKLQNDSVRLFEPWYGRLLAVADTIAPFVVDLYVSYFMPKRRDSIQVGCDRAETGEGEALK